MKYVPDFGEDLRFSMEPNYQLLMESFYKQFFGTTSRVIIRRISEIEEQRRGYDVVVQLENDIWYRIEEKRDRWSNTGNIVLELWSDLNKKKGWLYTSRADYLAYHYDGTAITHLIPMPALRKAWVENELEWRDTYRVMVKENRNWCTQFILIPLEVMWSAIQQELIHDHKAADGSRWREEY